MGEDKYPSQTAMECHAAAFGLTYKQVRDWFVEKRRRKKRENRTTELFSGRNGLAGGGATRVGKHCQTSYKAKAPSSSRNNEKVEHNFIQELLTPDYILKKLFRMDGPPLGVEFDSLPYRAHYHSADPHHSSLACNENQRATKRRKVTKPAVISHQDCNESAPDARDFPVGMGFANGEVANVSLTPTSVSRKLLTRNRRFQQKKLVPKQEERQQKRKNFVKRREMVLLRMKLEHEFWNMTLRS